MALDPTCSASLQAQEFELHGVEMRGPCRTLEKAGCSGKYTSNIQRDILRDVEKRNPIQAMSVKSCLCGVPWLFVFEMLMASGEL